MSITVKNQIPQTLSYMLCASPQGSFDALDILRTHVARKLLTPISQGTQAEISANGHVLSEDDLTDLIAASTAESVDPATDAAMEAIYEKTLVNYTPATSLTPNNVFINQSATSHHLDLPTTDCIYTASDAVDAAKDYLRHAIDADTFFATFGCWKRPRVLAISCLNAREFDSFKAWVASEVASVPNVPAAATQLAKSFSKLDLDDVALPIAIRTSLADNNDENSFARLLPSLLMRYSLTVSDAVYPMPFDLSELVCPTRVMFINVDMVAHSTPAALARAWRDIDASLGQRPQVLSTKSICRLDAVSRAQKKAQQKAATALSAQGQAAARAVHRKFSKATPNAADLTQRVLRIMDHMAQVAHSQNVFKRSHRTFARANRRHPDDVDRTGLSVSTAYKPDIHVYVDTSGSITEENYEAAVKSLIALTKRLDVNLYFTSFSHMMSPSYLVRARGRSVREIYAQVEKFPKVTGGTDYAQIWNYINNSRVRQRELSIIITDFWYLAPNVQVKHPKNLYYFPCSSMDWTEICQHAETFCQSMVHIDPTVRNKLLF